MRSTLTALALAVGCSPSEELSGLSAPASDDLPTAPTLVGRAVLPAASFAPGPTSGTRLGPGPINGQPVPFVDKQPIQGFSALLDNGDGTFLALSDNGFGKLEDSADYLLRLYHVRPQLETASGGAGAIDVLGFIQLQDPDGKVPFTITNERTAHRHLTGADFDPESVQRAADGTLWLGDEFGPFLIHVDANGRLLDPPVPLPDFTAGGGAEIRTPQSPLNEEATAVRIMNAVSARAHRRPAISPYHRMLADGDPTTFVETRQSPPPGSGLAPASSEIFDVASLKAAGYPVVAWTVNSPARMRALLALGLDGIVADRPDVLYQVIAAHDANGDGTAGDYLDAEGLIDRTKIDAQAHRGGRDLRPENTLPAIEAALDHLMTGLELDVGLTRDRIPVLDHAQAVRSETCRHAHGPAYEPADEVLVRDLTAAELQHRFICDKLIRGPEQRNDPAASPAAVAYGAATPTLPHIYVMPTLDQVFAFVDFYVDYYRHGAGAGHPDAARRWKNAARVHFSLETRTDPRAAFADRAHPPALFAHAVGHAITSRGLAERADVQSLDFRNLLRLQDQFPAIRTVYMFGDTERTDGGGANLEPEGANSPWLAGLRWPYRVTKQSHPFRAQRSVGFEGLAISPDRTRLYPMLEKPLAGDPPKLLRIFEFDLATRQYIGERATYLIDSRGTSVRDFIMFAPDRGLVIEIDGSDGDLAGWKRVFQVTLPASPGPAVKQQAADLLLIAAPAATSLPAAPGAMDLGDPFAYLYKSIEALELLDGRRLVVVNDNNFPFDFGRHGPGRADDTELIVVDLGLDLRCLDGASP
jgi:glycerophosphoryl diester phosphodiesterase